jgi:SAM-dependent methyltransferase
MGASSQDFYADAHLYDVLHAGGTRREVSVHLAIARAHLPRTARHHTIFEPASGTGRYLIDLARRGHTCLGIDLLPAMTRYARAAARRALAHTARTPPTLLTGDMCRFTWPARIGPADWSFCPINSIRHLRSDAQMLAHLRLVRRHTRPGGLYIVGLEVIDPPLLQPTEDVWHGRVPGLSVRQIVQYLPPEEHHAADARSRHRFEQVISHLVVKQRNQARGSLQIPTPRGRDKGGALPPLTTRRSSLVAPLSTRHIDSVYTLRTYTLGQWLGVIHRSGWSLLATYNAEGTLRPRATLGYYLWVLRAP